MNRDTYRSPRRAAPLFAAALIASSCGLGGGRELQATVVTPGVPFSFTVPMGPHDRRAVWVGFDDDQHSHFVLSSTLTLSNGSQSLSVSWRMSATQFAEGSVSRCPNPTGRGPGRCVSSSSFNVRTFNRTISGRTWLFDVPPNPSGAPLTISGTVVREVGDSTAPPVLRIVITE